MTAILNALMGAGFKFQPITRIYNTAGTFTETIPNGARQVVIECWGGAGGGGANFGSGCTLKGGGGGGSAGYCRSVYNVTGAAGQTMGFNLGAQAVASSVSSGTYTITTMLSNPGQQGGAATSTTPGNGGSGGTASGGNTQNITGNAGTNGSVGSQGTGGPGVVGVNGTGANGGPPPPGPGKIIFAYT